MDIDRRIEELAAQRRDFMMRIANIKQEQLACFFPSAGCLQDPNAAST